MSNTFTRNDAKFLLEKLNNGMRVLVASSKIGLPTIHEIPHARHLGMGLFRADDGDYVVYFDAGGAMDHTPDGASYTILTVESGTYPYDFDAAKAALESVIANGNISLY